MQTPATADQRALDVFRPLQTIPKNILLLLVELIERMWTGTKNSPSWVLILS